MTLRLNGDSSGFTEIKAPNAAGDNSITLPTSNGGANQLLQNGGTAGALQYTSAGDGLRFDSSGRLLVGQTTSLLPYSNLQVTGGSDGAGHVTLSRVTQNPTNNQNIGSLRFTNNGGGIGAQIAIEADGDWTAGSSHPTRIVLATAESGAGSATGRVEIGSGGALKLLAGCPGIDFSAIQSNAGGMTSETLDCYEEGTWSPVLAGQSTAGTMELVSGGSVGGQYTKIGNYFVARAAFSNVFLTGASGNLILTGLPFACVSAKGGAGGYVQYLEGFDPAYSNSFDGSDAIVMRQLSAASVNFRPQYANKWDTYVNAPNTLFQRSGGSSAQRMYGDIVLYGFTD